MSSSRLLVLGASGFVGQQVCEYLIAAGHRVTVPTRRRANASRVQHLPGLDVVQADVHNQAELAQLLPGHDAVVNLVAVLQGSAAAFERVHVQLPRQLGLACKRAGIERLIHVSALGCGPAAPSNYLRSKTQGEAALAQAGLTELVIVRPSVIFGAGDRFLNLFAKLQAVFAFMPLAGANAQFQPVWVADVASLLVKLAVSQHVSRICCYEKYSKDASPNPLVIEAAGPQTMSLRDIVAAAGRYGGHARPIITLPGPLATLQACLMELAPGEPLMSRDNLASMLVPNVASSQLPGLLDCGITPSSLHAIAPTYLGGQGPRKHLDDKRSGH